MIQANRAFRLGVQEWGHRDKALCLKHRKVVVVDPSSFLRHVVRIAAIFLAFGSSSAGATEIDVFLNATPRTAFGDPDLPSTAEASLVAGGLKVQLTPLTLSNGRLVLTNWFHCHAIGANEDVMEALLGVPTHTLHGVSWQPGT